MPQDLARLLEDRLPPHMLALLRVAARIGEERRWRVCLVGGSVRDLLLGVHGLDIDLVVEGNGPQLAELLAEAMDGRLLTRSQFGTASVRVRGQAIDVATARKERYPHPGALPVVTASNLLDDLFRRDFSIHAMACDLMPGSWGELIDPYGGQADIEARWLRVLHEASFTDDPTRMLRAARYATRLSFNLEPQTEQLLLRDRGLLGRVSGARRWKELQRIFEEEQPERSLLMADALGLLPRVHPWLAADAWLAGACVRARQQAEGKPGAAVYMCLLAFNLSSEQRRELAVELALPASVAGPLRDLSRARQAADSLAAGYATPAETADLLGGIAPAALRAVAAATEDRELRERIDRYLTEWVTVKPRLSGDRLEALGIPPGPGLGRCLTMLRRARLDGRTHSEEDEIALVRQWLASRNHAEGAC